MKSLFKTICGGAVLGAAVIHGGAVEAASFTYDALLRAPSIAATPIGGITGIQQSKVASNGSIAFSASTRVGESSFRSGLYVHNSEGPRLILSAGDRPDALAGSVIQNILEFDINASEHLVAAVRLNNGSAVIRLDDAGEVTVIARSGDVISSSEPFTASRFNGPFLNDDGDAFFRADDAAASSAIIRNRNGTNTALAATGDTNFFGTRLEIVGGLLDVSESDGFGFLGTTSSTPEGLLSLIFFEEDRFGRLNNPQPTAPGGVTSYFQPYVNDAGGQLFGATLNRLSPQDPIRQVLQTVDENGLFNPDFLAFSEDVFGPRISPLSPAFLTDENDVVISFRSEDIFVDDDLGTRRLFGRGDILTDGDLALEIQRLEGTLGFDDGGLFTQSVRFTTGETALITGTTAAVPLPAGLPLFLGALVLLGFSRRWA